MTTISKFNDYIYMCDKCIEKYIYNSTTINESISKIDYLCIVVPTRGCVNKCKFCVSKMNKIKYEDLSNSESFEKEYLEKLNFASYKGAKIANITGDGEPIQNKSFLKTLGKLFNKMDKRFNEIEFQTTGVMLDDDNLNFLKNEIGITLVSLSISDLISDVRNKNIINIPPELLFKIKNVISKIKSKSILVRLSLNLTKNYNNRDIDSIFQTLSEMGVDQCIFRILWRDKSRDEIDRWILANSPSKKFQLSLDSYIKTHGEYKGGVPPIYIVNGISVVFDNDNTMNVDSIKKNQYLILRSDACLYNRWDSEQPVII